jgi:hypothetical protein
MEVNDFTLEEACSNRTILPYTGGRFILRLIAPIVFLVLGGIIKAVATVFRSQDSLSGVLLSWDLMFGEALILKARKNR